MVLKTCHWSEIFDPESGCLFYKVLLYAIINSINKLVDE